MATAQVRLPGHASSVPTARRFVESMLAAWGQPEAGWAAALCISELAANCTLHARTEFAVRVLLEGDAVRLEVTDGSPRSPSRRDYGADATTGRGLQLVDAYARSWGVDPHADGKTVWVLLDADSATGQADADEEELSVDALLAAFDEGTSDVQARSWIRQVAA